MAVEIKDDNQNEAVTGGGNSGISGILTKKPVLLIVVALLLAGGGVLYKIFGTVKDLEQTTQTQVQLLGVNSSVVDGTVSYKTVDGDWQALATGVSLTEGSSVKTDVSGRAVLTFDDGSALRVDSSSEVQLASLDPSNVRIVQASGTAYSRVVASGRTYTVETDGTDYTALGTAFTTINTTDESGVQVIESKVKVDGVDTEISEGQQHYKKHKNSKLKDKTTDIDVASLKKSKFMNWCLEQDEKDEKFKDKLGLLAKFKEKDKKKDKKDDSDTRSVDGIKLTAYNNSKGTVLSWSISDVKLGEGFKVVRSKHTSTPKYGVDESNLVSSDTRSFTWNGDQYQKDYWYRVCIYRGDGKCDTYSNAVQKRSVYKAPKKVKSGTMTLSKDESAQKFYWTFTGEAPYGFKFNWSKSHNPSYGGAGSSSHLTGGNKMKFSDLELDPATTYYFRVCAYTSGTDSEACKYYSDEVEYTTP